MISIRMLKICGKSIIKPLLIIYKKCLEKGCFSSEWKKANVVPVHKKNGKQLLKNYRPVSLLPICSKFWRGYSVTECLNFLSKIIWSLLISLVLRQVTRASTNLFPSLTKYINHLMMARKYGVYFWYIESIGQVMAPRSSLQTKTKWYIQWTFRHFDRFLR